MSDNEDNAEITLRPLVWMGDSRKNIREFPEDSNLNFVKFATYDTTV